MKTISLDLRERILAAYDAGEGTRQAVAGRFRVSLGLIKMLLHQRRRRAIWVRSTTAPAANWYLSPGTAPTSGAGAEEA